MLAAGGDVKALEVGLRALVVKERVDVEADESASRLEGDVGVGRVAADDRAEVGDVVGGLVFERKAVVAHDRAVLQHDLGNRIGEVVAFAEAEVRFDQRQLAHGPRQDERARERDGRLAVRGDVDEVERP